MCKEIYPNDWLRNVSHYDTPNEVVTKSDVEAKFSWAIRVYHRTVCCREFARGLFISLTNVRAWNDAAEVSLRLLIDNE